MDSIKPLRKEGILSRKTGDEWILYDQGKKSVHIINSTAEFVWSLCDGSNSLSYIAKQMHDTFQISEDHDVIKDLDQIIKTFFDLGILET